MMQGCVKKREKVSILTNYYNDLTDQKTEYMYRKHQQISHTFSLKIFVKKLGCGLSVRLSGGHAINLHK